MTLNRRMMIAAAGLAAGGVLPATAAIKLTKIKDLSASIEKASQTDGVLVLQRTLDREVTTLREFPLATPLVAGSDCAVELRKVGQKLTVKLNGMALGDVQVADDPTLKGTFGVANYSNPTTATAKALQFLPLPSPAPAAPK